MTVHAHAAAAARSSAFFFRFLIGVLGGGRGADPSDAPGNSPSFQCRFLGAGAGVGVGLGLGLGFGFGGAATAAPRPEAPPPPPPRRLLEEGVAGWEGSLLLGRYPRGAAHRTETLAEAKCELCSFREGQGRGGERKEESEQAEAIGVFTLHTTQLQRRSR